MTQLLPRDWACLLELLYQSPPGVTCCPGLLLRFGGLGRETVDGGKQQGDIKPTESGLAAGMGIWGGLVGPKAGWAGQTAPCGAALAVANGSIGWVGHPAWGWLQINLLVLCRMSTCKVRGPCCVQCGCECFGAMGDRVEGLCCTGNAPIRGLNGRSGGGWGPRHLVVVEPARVPLLGAYIHWTRKSKRRCSKGGGTWGKRARLFDDQVGCSTGMKNTIAMRPAEARSWTNAMSRWGMLLRLLRLGVLVGKRAASEEGLSGRDWLWPCY